MQSLITLVYLGWYSKANIVSFIWVCQTQIINLEAARNAQVLSWPIAQRKIFPLVNEFSQYIIFKSFKCINSQIILLKQLLMPVAELVGTRISMGSLAAFYIAPLSLHFIDLGVKIKEKDLY